MELRHLRYFIAAAEEEHFGRASERLHVSRPAVSQIIADLESEIGAPLFERLARRVRLTAAGQALLPKVQRIMADLGEAIADAGRVGRGTSGSLNIGYGSLTLLHSLFREAIKQFRDAYPDVTLSLFEMPTTDQVKALADGRIHAGFMHFGPHSALLRRQRDAAAREQTPLVFDWLRIQKGGLGVVMPEGHRLARRKSVRLAELAELAGERLVVVARSVSSPGYDLIHSLGQKAGYEPSSVQEVGTISAQLNLVSVGLGIGLIVIGKGFAYPRGVVVVPLEDVAYVNSFVFGWVKGQRDPALERMIEIVKGLARDD